MFGRFHEVSVETRDIRASIEFYEQLGFSQCETGDIWSHPYGVVTDGRLVIGLHEYRFASPSLTFVRAELARQLEVLEARGLEIAFRRMGEDVFHEFGLRDPDGHMLTLLEARTYSPSARTRDEASLCGDFVEFSLTSGDFGKSREFWEAAGFVATSGDEDDAPWQKLVLTSDHLDLAFHRPRFHDGPLLVFANGSLQVEGKPEARPRGLGAHPARALESPEGLTLLLL